MRDQIIVDLDGTLALDQHRNHHLQKTPRDWATYFSLCGEDKPNQSIIQLVRELRHAGYFIHIISGRIDTYRDTTMQWLARYKVEYDTLNMRGASNRTQDTELKLRMATEIGLRPDNVLFCLEDRARVVAAWRAEGYTCLQVAPGDF
jgi:phosphoglycolate phosphatase-like HAD superfamily hydrolase